MTDEKYVITEKELHGANMVLYRYGCESIEATPLFEHDAEQPHHELAERECAINNCLRKDWLQRHDAEIAQQSYRNGFDEGFAIGKAQCETHHAERDAEIAKKERERVLDGVIRYVQLYRWFVPLHSLIEFVESLRVNHD